ncbi:MAG: LCP family protein, partial [Anaerolineae bacterium]|nr:LCP family protein [Anaerolineae bacterium]
MVAESNTNQRAARRWTLGNILFWLVATLLLLGIVWSSVQVVQAFWGQYSQQNETSARAENYQQTATSIAPPAVESGYDNGDVRLVQFATNTPNSSELPTSTPGSSGLATNTPAVAATSVPATPIPEDVNRETTPIPLPTFFAVQDASVQQIAGTAVPPRAAVIPRDYELVNILLMGSDGEITADNTLRTDTMIIVSINTEVGSVSMLTLPRDLFVYVPTPTMVRLNTVYGIGESFGWSGGGFGLMRETIFYNFGIQLHYYALVNLSGLEQIVDAVGGVDVAVDCAYRDFALVGAEVPDAAVVTDEEALEYTLPVGYYHFSGAEALWYARTRGNSDDFDRGRRQERLLRAIYRAALDTGQLANLPTLWSELTQVVQTDVPLDLVLGLLPVALNLDTSRIRTFGLIRTYHTTPWQPTEGSFAGQFVQLPNADPLAELFFDFYQPPTQSRLEMAGATVAVYNGTQNENWDLVASERLREAGINSYAAGSAPSQD